MKNDVHEKFKSIQIAEFLGVSRPTLLNMLVDGRLGGLDLAAIYDYAVKQGKKERDEEIIKMIKS
jgi:hypothetical protein